MSIMEENLNVSTSSQLPENIEADSSLKCAKLEQELFVMTKQLEESQAALAEAKKQNSLLANNVKTLESDQAKKIAMFQECEKQRDQLIIQRKELQNENAILSSQKNAMETQVAKLINEKRHLSEDITILQNDLTNTKSQVIKFQLELDSLQSDKNIIEYEKERWKQEKEILTQSKQWFMREINDRDAKISQMRIDMSNMEMNFGREKSRLNDEKLELTKKADELKKVIESNDQEILKSKDRMQELIQERTSSLAAMETEMRSQSRLAKVYKESLDSLSKEIEEIRNSEELAQALLRESEDALSALKQEIEDVRQDLTNQIAEKGSQIEKLNDELKKANELIKIGARVPSSDEDISALSPAAAAAANLIKSGISLTAIYTEHIRVLNELEKKEEENRRIEKYVQELVEDLDAKAPYLREQREQHEKAISEIERLRAQIDLLSNERQRLVNARDAAERELAFTKSELVKYQRDHHNMAVQVRRLLYVIEKGKDASIESEDEATEQRLFTDISELQERNMELRMKLDELETKQDEIVRNVSNDEIERLSKLLNENQNELDRIREHQSKQGRLIEELEKQRDDYARSYEELMSNSGNIHQHRDTRRSLERAESEYNRWKHQAEILEEKLNTLGEDRRNMEKLYLERIDQQMETISQLRTTNGKLESDLEYQKKNQQLILKQNEDLESTMKQRDDNQIQQEVRFNTLQSRFDELSRQILEKQHELSSLKISNRSLEEQLAISNSNVQRLSTEVEILRQTRFNTERVALTLQEVQATLQRVDAEKTQGLSSQLESITIERDNFKRLVENIKEQNDHFTNELKLKLLKVESERDQSQVEVEALKRKLTETEARFNDLREQHDQLTRQLTEVQSSDSNIESCKKEIQQLRNKNIYLEKQVAELEDQVLELREQYSRKESELKELTKLSGNMEDVISRQNEYLKLEQDRLQTLLSASTSDLLASRQEVESLRNEISALELRHLERDRDEETKNQEFLKKISALEQDYNEVSHRDVEKAALISDLETKLGIFDAQLIEARNRLAQFEVEIQSQRQALNTASTRINELEKGLSEASENYRQKDAQRLNTINALEQEKLHLRTEIDKLISRDRESIEKTQILYDQIQMLTQRVSVVGQLQEASGETSVSSQESESFQVILRHLRSEKEKEMELRMNAELELQRLKTQADIDHERIRQLEDELGHLKVDIEANIHAIAEKDQIINELSILQQVQENNEVLQRQVDELKLKLNLAETKLKETLARCLSLNAEKATIDARLKTTETELDQQRKEAVSLRERNEKAMALVTKYTGEKQMLGDFEKQKQQLNHITRELTFYKEKAEKAALVASEAEAKMAKFADERSKLEEAKKAEEDKFVKARGLARQFRDESKKLQTENESLKSELEKKKAEIEELQSNVSKPASVTTGWPIDTSATTTAADKLLRLNTMLSDSKAEVIRLKAENNEISTKLSSTTIRITQLEAQLEANEKQLEDRTKEASEAAELKSRIDLIESTLATSQKRVQTLKDENEKLKQQLCDLNAKYQETIERSMGQLEASKTQQVVESSEDIIQDMAPSISSSSQVDNISQPVSSSAPTDVSRKRGFDETLLNEALGSDEANKRSRIDVSEDQNLSVSTTAADLCPINAEQEYDEYAKVVDTNPEIASADELDILGENENNEPESYGEAQHPIVEEEILESEQPASHESEQPDQATEYEEENAGISEPEVYEVESDEEDGENVDNEEEFEEIGEMDEAMEEEEMADMTNEDEMEAETNDQVETIDISDEKSNQDIDEEQEQS